MAESSRPPSSPRSAESTASTCSRKRQLYHDGHDRSATAPAETPTKRGPLRTTSTTTATSLAPTTSAYRVHFSCQHIGRYRSSTKRQLTWYVPATHSQLDLEKRSIVSSFSPHAQLCRWFTNGQVRLRLLLSFFLLTFVSLHIYWLTHRRHHVIMALSLSHSPTLPSPFHTTHCINYYYQQEIWFYELASGPGRKTRCRLSGRRN